MIKVVTIGVYGFSEESFFQALQEHQVDTFCDIRQRRGLRGKKYAFANSKRLQNRLKELGIRYLHLKELSPTAAVREQQREADRISKTPKRRRHHLSPAFVTAYEKQVLAAFDPESFIADLPADSAVVALFCVEREPEACHRSLVAERLKSACGISLVHVIP